MFCSRAGAMGMLGRALPRACGVQRFVFLSSAAAYGDTPGELVAAAVQRAIPGARISFAPGLANFGYRRDALNFSALAQDLGFEPAIGIDDGVARYRDCSRRIPDAFLSVDDATRACLRVVPGTPYLTDFHLCAGEK